mgnify:FL=1
MIADRLELLNTLDIDVGGHSSFEDGHCSMELVSWLAGEEYSFRPKCACPVPSKFVIKLNDRIVKREMRTKLLRPILPKLVDSAVGPEATLKRMYVASDAIVRIFIPIVLDAEGFQEWAQTMRDMPEIIDEDTMYWAEAWLKLISVHYTYVVAHIAITDCNYAADYSTYSPVASAVIAAVSTAVDAEAEERIYAKAVKVIERMLEIK